MQASYEKRPTDGGYVFEVRPAPPPSAAGVLGFQLAGVAVLAVIIYSVVHGSGGSAVIAMLAAVGFAALAYMFFKRQIDKVALKQRHETKFAVTEAGIEAQGSSISRDDMHRFVFKNWTSNVRQDFDVHVVVGTPGIDFAVKSLNAVAGQVAGRIRSGYERKVAEVSWQLDIEAGGRATMLACGLDDVTARGLMTDIARVL